MTEINFWLLPPSKADKSLSHQQPARNKEMDLVTHQQPTKNEEMDLVIEGLAKHLMKFKARWFYYDQVFLFQLSIRAQAR